MGHGQAADPHGAHSGPASKQSQAQGSQAVHKRRQGVCCGLLGRPGNEGTAKQGNKQAERDTSGQNLESVSKSIALCIAGEGISR